MDVKPVRPGLFSGMKDARIMGDYKYIAPALGWLRLDSTRCGENRKKEENLIVSGTVIRILDNPEGKADPIGSEVSRVTKRASEYFLSEAATFIAGAMGISADEAKNMTAKEMQLDPADIARMMQATNLTQDGVMQLTAADIVFGPLQPLAMSVVEYHTHTIITQKNTPFVKISWVRPVPYSEVLDYLLRECPDNIARFFPHDFLKRAIEAEQA